MCENNETEYIQQVAKTIWSQIPTIEKMSAGACKPRAYFDEARKHPGLVFHINPAVGGFIPLDVDVERYPRFYMRVLLDEGADTYIMERVHMRDEKGKLVGPKTDWHLDDVYFDQLGELLYRMTTDDPPKEA
jgi:hypothetical protein